MTTIIMQCTFCEREFSLKWFIPEDGGETGNLGDYICNAFPKGIPAFVELGSDSPEGSKKCPKFITKQAMDEDDRELMAEMPWF